MPTNIVNPFANFGGRVSGSRFIGRKSALRDIESRVINPKRPGNMAIIGMPHIGKCSLVYKAIFERREELIKRNILPIRLDLSLYDQPEDFFRSLIECCVEELDNLELTTGIIHNTAKLALQDYSSWPAHYRSIQRFFEKVHKVGIHVIFVIENFDHASTLFRGRVSRLQGLRELVDYPESGVSLVIISQRSLRDIGHDIEIQAEILSTFDGIFDKCYVSVFEKEELKVYFERLNEAGINIVSLLVERIDFYCGGHPYLLEMLGFQLVKLHLQTQQEEGDVDAAVHFIEHLFFDYYEQLWSLLSKDENHKKLLKIIFGPAIDVKPADIDRLLSYGLIKIKQKKHVAFSSHFQAFLDLEGRDIDLWPLITKTELMLRTVIAQVMHKVYGEQWFDKLNAKYPKLGGQDEKGRNLFQRCLYLQRTDKERTSGREISENPLDYSYPQDLINIINVEWSEFKPIFERVNKKDKKYWNSRFNLFAEVRAPLAHNRSNLIKDHERRTAEGFCMEIVEALFAYLTESEDENPGTQLN